MLLLCKGVYIFYFYKKIILLFEIYNGICIFLDLRLYDFLLKKYYYYEINIKKNFFVVWLKKIKFKIYILF